MELVLTCPPLRQASPSLLRDFAAAPTTRASTLTSRHHSLGSIGSLHFSSLSKYCNTATMRATLARRITFPGLNRANTVPHWQQVHQNHADGLRQWQKGPRAKIMLYPYYALLMSSSSACMYMMCRMVLGKKTWY